MPVRNPDEIFVHPNEFPEACQGALHPMAVKGISLFDERQYWEAHEALEAAWLDEEGPARHLYKGILQAGVTYLQIEWAWPKCMSAAKSGWGPGRTFAAAWMWPRCAGIWPPRWIWPDSWAPTDYPNSTKVFISQSNGFSRLNRPGAASRRPPAG